MEQTHGHGFRIGPLGAVFFSVLIGMGAGTVHAAQTDPVDQWLALIRAERIDAARTLCTGWLKKSDKHYRAEGHKCLANVEGAAARTIMLEGDDTGGGQIRPGFAGEALDRALNHLDEAIRLAPEDLSIHQGRLHMLMVSGQFSRTAEALKDSLKSYTGPDALEEWLDYSPRFFAARKFAAGAAFMQVLEARYPDEHRIIANIGGLLFSLGKDEEAIRYSERAVKLNPEDPINTWNLGWMYEHTGKIREADTLYRRSFDAPTVPGQTVEQNCIHYAEFVENRRSDPKRACAIRKQYCPDQAPDSCGD